MTARPTYATREQVMRAMDVQYTAYAADKIDRALQTFARMIEKKCQRPGGLFPTLRTLYWDWPDISQPTSWRLWVEPDNAISLVSLSSGGTTISGAYLAAGDGTTSGVGPPYNQIQLDRSLSYAFGGGSTPQRNVTGVLWTGWNDEQEPAGTLAAAIATTSVTTCTVSDGAAVGVGDQLIIDSERLVVTGRAMVTTTQTITADVASATSTVGISVSSGAAFTAGETILIDSERMRIVDIAGNTLTVKRAYDGTVLAAHTSGATVYAPRLLTVARGCQGSTAATHLISTQIYRWVPPPEVETLNLSEALNQLQQESSGMARQIGEGESVREVNARGLKDLRNQVYNTELRRRARSWAV
jgi:hypothetical protein